MLEKKSDFVVTLPSMGEGVQEATLNKWLCKPGDEVKKDEPLLEVSTDKVDTEIMSPYTGFFIASFAEPGTLVKVNQSIAQISLDKKASVLSIEMSSSEESSQQKEKTSQRKPRGENFSNLSFTGAPQTSKSFAGSLRSSPLVRKMAQDYGIPLGDVQGSGQYARVTKEDLLIYLENHGSSGTQQIPSPEILQSSTLETEKKEGKEFIEGVEIKREPMSKIRKATADHMLRSIRTSPHVTTTFEVCLDKVLELKKEKSAYFEKEHGIKLTLTPFFISACAKALKEHPHVNASVDGYDILLKEDINVACAVATEDGLFVPVLKRLQGSSFTEIVTRFSELVTKTREKKLEFSDLAGGTFSITNPGMYGSLHSQPIINQPQVAILSVGAMIKRPVLEGSELRNETICQIGLTFDHRLVDGQLGAFFLSTVKKTLENPSL